MKKLLLILVTVSMLVSMFGCRSAEEMKWELEYHRAVLSSLRLYAKGKIEIDSLKAEIEACKTAKEMRAER